MQKFNSRILDKNANYLQVDLIGQDGQKIGIVSIEQAQAIAQEQKLDLMQINNLEIPLCKLIDYSKFIYQKKIQQKKLKKTPNIKQLKFSLNMGEGDYQTRKKKAIELIESNHSIKCSLFLKKGREQTFVKKGISFLEKFQEDIKLFAVPVSAISIQGKEISVIVNPINKKRGKVNA